MATAPNTPVLVGHDRFMADLVTRMEGMHERFRSHGALDWPMSQAIVKALIERIPAGTQPAPAMRAWGGYDEAHAVNVAVQALTVARAFDFKPDRLIDLGLAALFHDLGKMIPAQHPRKAELRKLETHGAVAFAMLSDMVDVLPRVTEWVRDHHERVDASGPHRNDAPSLEAQILGIVDIYDANLTPHPRRATLSPHTAWNLTMRIAGPKFAPEVVEAFRTHIVPYSPGSRVTLTGGSAAIVVEPPRPENPLAPVIKAGDGEIINLADYAAPRVANYARPDR